MQILASQDFDQPSVIELRDEERVLSLLTDFEKALYTSCVRQGHKSGKMSLEARAHDDVITWLARSELEASLSLVFERLLDYSIRTRFQIYDKDTFEYYINHRWEVVCIHRCEFEEESYECNWCPNCQAQKKKREQSLN